MPETMQSLRYHKERNEGTSAKMLLRFLREQLEEAGIEEATGEAWIFLEWICGIDRGSYYMDPDAVVDGEKKTRLLEMLAKRKKRMPLQYLMGSCEFMGYPFYVDERVLIPRQDTECLVEQAVDAIRQAARQQSRSWEPKILDLCTGSGCIGISIKKMYPKAIVTLEDISEGALKVAAFNAKKLDAPVQLVQGDLFEHIEGSYDFIVSNPPYIPTDVINTLMPEVKDHEPRLALDGTGDGLEFYRRIIRESKEHLVSGGWLIFEIGMDQGADLRGIFDMEGYRDVEIRQDLAGLDRVTAGRYP